MNDTQVEIDSADPNLLIVRVDGVIKARLRKSNLGYHAFFENDQEVVTPTLAELVPLIKRRLGIV